MTRRRETKLEQGERLKEVRVQKSTWTRIKTTQEKAEMSRIVSKKEVIYPRKQPGYGGKQPSNVGCYTFGLPDVSRLGIACSYRVMQATGGVVAVCREGVYLGLFRRSGGQE